ncbi:MAG: PepSY domain-containing protein [Hyphomonas sp.]|uniref:PepSY domain-containing protein n=1 Tax=Hyphomonas sp. TaxID=87 RepID=UPI003528E5C3
MKRIAALLLAFGLLGAPAALAQGWMNQFSPGQARESVQEGKTVPLSKIFESLKREYGGYQLGADLYRRDDGSAVYEIDWMTGDGRKAHFVVDANTGRILDRRGA